MLTIHVLGGKACFQHIARGIRRWGRGLTSQLAQAAVTTAQWGALDSTHPFPAGLQSEGQVGCQRVWFREKGVFLVYRWHGPLHAGLTGAERTPVLPHLWGPHSVPEAPLHTLSPWDLDFHMRIWGLGDKYSVHSNLTKNRQMQVFPSRRCLEDESTQRRHNIRNESHQKWEIKTQQALSMQFLLWI